MMNNKIKVLIVDDNSDDVYLIKELLKDITVIQFELLHEKSLNSALELIENNKNNKFDCILLDLNLPDSLGTDTLKNMLNRFPGLSVVILTALDDEDIALKLLQDGAQDYLVKGKINGEIVYRSIRYAIERKKAENGLRESEKKYKNIADTILEGLWTTDAEGKTTYVNKQLAEMLGYIPEEILNQPFFNFVDKPLQNDARQFFERRKKGFKDRYDFRFVKKDGSILWVIVSASPIFDNKGKFVGTMGLLTNIAERKLNEQLLEKSAQQWNSTFNAISDIICVIDSEGKITRCNHASERLFKKPYENIIGKTCWEVLNCPSERLKKCPIINMQKTHKRETVTQQIDGKWFHSSVDPIIDDKGNMIGGVHIISDITKYKLAQNQLRESEEKWRIITENSAEYILTVDLNGIIQFINRTVTIPKEKVIGTSFYSYFSDKFKQVIKNCFERIKNTRRPDSYYAEYIRSIHPIDPIDPIHPTYPKDGNVLSYEAHVGPIIKSDKVVGFVISSLDITERKKAEDALRESEQLYRTITEYSNDMIWTLDSEGNFLFFNRRSEIISGYKLEDLKGKHFSPLIIEKDLSKVNDVFYNVLHGQPQQYEVTFKNKFNKHITLSVNTAPIYSKGRVTGTVSFGRDITQNKKTEKRIKKTTEELKRSNKELEQFAYIASHDLQEPLRSVYGFTELLKRRYKGKLDNEADEFIEYIVAGTKRMQQMINDLLALSRVGTRGKEFKPTNTADILKTVLENLHFLIEKNQAIVTHDDMPTIMADETQLIQLFQNLIDNAIKFRKKEVIPEIHISATLSTKQHIKQNNETKQDNGTRQEGDEWIFSVQDNGIGIDPKDFNKLFIVFHRLHSREKYPGTGIGLSMCKKIVERHRGKIWLGSKLGEGSTFYFTIPVKINNNQNHINNG